MQGKESSHNDVPPYGPACPGQYLKALLQIKPRAASECHGCFQADDLPLIFSVGISKDGVGSLVTGSAADFSIRGSGDSQEESPLAARRPW
jgi:hypothetical protein